MKITIFYHHILMAIKETGRTLLDILCELKKEGLSGVEVCAPDLTPQLLTAMEEAGLSVSSLYRMVPVFLGETEKGLQLVDRAAEIGCKTVMLLPGAFPADMDKETARKKSEIPLKVISDYGAEKGVAVTVEDYDGERTLFGSSCDMRYFETTAPNLYYTYDSGNFYTSEDVLDALSILKNKIRHVHLKDYAHMPSAWCGKARLVRSGEKLYDVPFGYGDLPAQEIITALYVAGYRGYLCLEHTEAENMMDANVAAIRRVKQFIDNLKKK